METRKYICNYCQKEFIPTRRRVQKYCSDSCRSGAHNLRKTVLTKTETKLVKTEKNQSQTKIDKISTAGVGNTALGTATYEIGKSIFTKEENKPATKGDLNILFNKIGRYHKITNHPARQNGALPYFDLYINEIIYSFLPLA